MIPYLRTGLSVCLLAFAMVAPPAAKADSGPLPECGPANLWDSYVSYSYGNIFITVTEYLCTPDGWETASTYRCYIDSPTGCSEP